MSVTTGTVAPMPPLVGVPEIAQRTGVSPRQVHRWLKRADFPAPLEALSSGRVWDWPDVEEWLHAVRPTLKPGRPPKTK